MARILENGLPITIIALTLLLICLITITGITSLVTFLAIIYVALLGLYTGYKLGSRREIRLNTSLSINKRRIQ